MKIIKSFSDYYDGVYVQDEDNKHTWVRENLLTSISSHSSKNCINKKGMDTLRLFGMIQDNGYSKYDTALCILNSLTPYLYSINEREKLSVHIGVLLVAGKIYPYALKRITQGYTHGVIEEITYDLNTTLGYFKETQHSNITEIEERFSNLWNGIIETWDADVIHRWCDSPIVLTHNKGRARDAESYISTATYFHFEKNTCLKDMEFQKVKDPYTLKQELEYYFCNVLSPNEKMVEVDNNSKVKAHGFDLKKSFRREKTKLNR